MVGKWLCEIDLDDVLQKDGRFAPYKGHGSLSGVCHYSYYLGVMGANAL